MKHLLIARHAKSDWDDHSLADIDRPLNKRGSRDAPMMGKRLFNRKIHPELIVTSPAVRAMTTAALYAKALHYESDKIVSNNAIYQASPEQLLEIIRHFDDDIDWIMLVGHNPCMSQLVNLLLGNFAANMPTCSLYGLEFAVDEWQAIGPTGATSLFFDYPKKDPQQKAS